MPYARRVVKRTVCAEESRGGHRGLKGKGEEDQVSAVDAVPRRSRERSRAVCVVAVFRSAFAGGEDVYEQVGESSAVSIGYLLSAYAADEPEYLPRRQRGEGHQRVDQVVVGHGRTNGEGRTAPQQVGCQLNR